MTDAQTAQPSRIERLRALAEHPNTSENEAELARRALARLLKKQPQAAAGSRMGAAQLARREVRGH